MLSGIVGGIYRSIEHAKSMSQYSISVIKLDALFIYGYKNANINVTIPQERYLSKEQHLKKLGIYDYHWGDEINKKSSKIIKIITIFYLFRSIFELIGSGKWDRTTDLGL